MVKNLIIYISVLLLFLGCSDTKNNHFDIHGAWYLIRQDTIYEENIFMENKVWTYDENFGEMLYGFEIVNDSLIFFKAKWRG